MSGSEAPRREATTGSVYLRDLISESGDILRGLDAFRVRCHFDHVVPHNIRVRRWRHVPARNAVISSVDHMQHGVLRTVQNS